MPDGNAEIDRKLSEILSRLTKIEGDVEHQKDLYGFSIASSERTYQFVAEAFNGRPGAARLYLALSDKPQTQDDLIAQLGLGRTTVSDLCNYLVKLAFIRRLPKRNPDGKYQYTWGVLEDLLGVSRIARKCP